MENIINQIKQEMGGDTCVQNYSPADWCAILGNQVYESTSQVLKSDTDQYRGGDELRYKLVKLAATSISMIECIDKMKAAENVTYGRQLEIEFPD